MSLTRVAADTDEHIGKGDKIDSYCPSLGENITDEYVVDQGVDHFVNQGQTLCRVR